MDKGRCFVNTETVCQYCGHENQVGWRFCSQCGKSRNPPTAAKPFPQVLEIHPEADLTKVLEDILRWERGLLEGWTPSVDQFKELCELKLTENQQQCLIRRYQLHLVGSQPVVSAASIARERGGSGAATMTALQSALSSLNLPVHYIVPDEVKDRWFQSL